jgi:F0F1-type ATP synthase assembly protein I
MNFKVLIGAVIGGAIGFAIGYFGKCASGVCPLTRNPYISTIIGIIFGILIVSK